MTTTISTKHLQMTIPANKLTQLRRQGWNLTRSLRRVNPFKLSPRDIEMSDIYWSLEKLARFTGQTIFFYSVAEHSVILSRVMRLVGADPGLDENEIQIMERQALLHDGNEAYFNDVSAPLGMQPESELIKEAKKLAMQTIFKAFGLPAELHPLVKRFDQVISEWEAINLFRRIPRAWVMTATAGELKYFENFEIRGLMPNGAGAGHFYCRVLELEIRQSVDTKLRGVRLSRMRRRARA